MLELNIMNVRGQLAQIFTAVDVIVAVVEASLQC